MECLAVCCSVLQCVTVCCSVLQCVAVCCSVLQCVAVYCIVFCVCWYFLLFPRSLMSRCDTLQHTTTHCNITLQHTPLRHTATRLLLFPESLMSRCTAPQHNTTHWNTLPYTAWGVKVMPYLSPLCALSNQPPFLIFLCFLSCLLSFILFFFQNVLRFIVTTVKEPYFCRAVREEPWFYVAPFRKRPKEI